MGYFLMASEDILLRKKIFHLFIYYNASKARRKCKETYRKLWKHEILNTPSLLVFWSPQNCAAISLTLRLFFNTNTFFLNKGAKLFLSGLRHFYSVTCFHLYIAKYTDAKWAPETVFIFLSKTTDFQKTVVGNVVYSLNVNIFLTTGYSVSVFHLIE
jgi:hypothetical protein